MSNFWWFVIGMLALVSILLRNNLLFLLSLFMLLVGGVALLWTRTCLTAVSYRRRIGAHYLFYGEETDLAIEVINAKPLPLAWLRAEDEMPAKLELDATPLATSHLTGRARLVNLMSLRWYERVTRRYRLRGARRGVWRFGPVEIISGDIFGFGVKREVVENVETVVVYPKLVPLTVLGLPALRPFGDLHMPRRLSEDPLRLTGAREYVIGDSFRHIHWKATAHRQALQTKVFEPSATLPLSIFLNINTFEQRYEGIDTELQEYAICAAASIARWTWENGHPVGLYVNSIAQPGAQRISIRPSSEPDQLLQILEALAQVVNQGRWPIETILQTEAQHLPYGASVVVVTATANAQLRHTCMELRRREMGVTLVTLGEKVGSLGLPGIRQHHIGGREEWDELASLDLA
ncbi:MAG: DUF58 domain-containing protein [Caldilineaceae bacterium]|nr:DUF58 domain-containing protein [Caldilineaceae bacterium]